MLVGLNKMPSKFISERRKKLIEHYYSNKIKDIELLIDNVWDPHNVAAVARTADGMGVAKINLYYTYNAFPDLKHVGKKSSSSANKWIKFEKIEDLGKFVSVKRAMGYKFIGAAVCKGAKSLLDYTFPGKCVIVFGAEKDGLSPDVRKICDELVFVPMAGMVESYNISVAAGIFMYEVFRQKGKRLKMRDLKEGKNKHE